MENGVSSSLSLASVIHALRAAVAAWGGRGWLAEALVLLVHRRLGELGLRMERMAARFRAGTLRSPAPRAVTGPLGARARAGARIWPRSFGWLVRAAAWEAAGFGLQLRAVLEAPEMVELLTACPQAVRVLRPLCRMLAIEPRMLRPGALPAVAVPRTRAPRPKVDWGNCPIPRGVLAAVRRERAAKRV